MIEKDAQFELNKVSIRLNKDAPLMSKKKITSPEEAVEVLGDELREFDREVIAIINLKADGTPINCTFASIGGLDRTLAQPRELLKSSILSNASSMIMIHNHPSGSLQPSTEDVRTTDRMILLCGLVGIPLQDHIIVAYDNPHYYSFREHDELKNLDKWILYNLKQFKEDIDFEHDYDSFADSFVAESPVSENVKKR